MSKRKRCNPRVRLHPNGTAVLSGINVEDLRSLLTWARLHNYEHPLDDKAKLDSMNVNWERRLVYILEEADKAILARYHETYPWNSRPKTKAERWKEVRYERDTRVLIDQIIEEEFAKRAGSSK